MSKVLTTGSDVFTTITILWDHPWVQLESDNSPHEGFAEISCKFCVNQEQLFLAPSTDHKEFMTGHGGGGLVAKSCPTLQPHGL